MVDKPLREDLFQRISLKDLCAHTFLAVFPVRDACSPARVLRRSARPNICAAHPILDGGQLVNHPFYQCPLRDSCAHDFPAVSLAREARPSKCELCLGRARRQNICAPHLILDGSRLGNHPFYRCPLKDSSAHAAPECRAHPLPAITLAQDA